MVCPVSFLILNAQGFLIKYLNMYAQFNTED